MNRFQLLLLVCGVLFLPWVPFANAQQISDITVEELRTHVKYLSSDELEGRRTGTRGNLLAAGYISGEFVQYGLEPVNGSYLHDFPYLKSVTAGPANSFAFLGQKTNGAEEYKQLLPKLDFAPLSFSSNGSVDGEIAFVGYGISAPDRKYDDYQNVDVDGKIVMMLRYSPPNLSYHDKEKDLLIYAGTVTKVLTAREKGASGIIMVDLDGYGDRPMSTSLMRGFTDAGMPVVSVRPGALDWFRDAEGLSIVEVREGIDKNRVPNSFLIEGKEASITTDLRFDRVNAPNVLGMVPGNNPTLKDEIIIVGAHFDHLGHGGSGSRHRDSDSAIHNGADDNASGTAGVIGLARYYGATRSNRRTIIFIAFNGEEEGLLGSAALVDNPPFNTENVVAMINLDMIGRLGNNELVVQGTGTATEWEEILERANSGGLLVKSVKDGFGPSDHSSFYAKQIPVLFFFTGLHGDYHRPSDDWELVNYEGLHDVVDLVGRVVGEIDSRIEPLHYVEVPRSAPRRGPRLRVVLGLIPDYGFDGKGLRLLGVSKGGPAEKGGVRSGDIIIRLNGKEVNGIEEYMYVLASTEPGKEVEVVLLRDETEVSTFVIPKKR